MRFSIAGWLFIVGAVSAACTPEAVEVDASTGGGGGQAGSAAECASISSPRPGCAECLNQACAQEISDCAGSDCVCRPYGDQRGQFNCLLACPTLSAKVPDDCARACGFGSFHEADPRTRALWDCLVVPPSGPPACRQCLSPP